MSVARNTIKNRTSSVSMRKRKLRRLKAKVRSGRYRISNLDLAKALFLAQ